MNMRYDSSSLPALCWSIQYESYSTIEFVCDYMVRVGGGVEWDVVSKILVPLKHGRVQL